jgi:hypothetical protein
MEVEEKINQHKLETSWCLWVHLPHDTDWSLKSYKLIYTFNSIEETISLINNLPEKLIKNCMLFIMRKNIFPIWEDDKNKEGGCFSFKVINKFVKNTWEKLTYLLVGENILIENMNNLLINGITISPKKNFCIIKIWLNTCEYDNPICLNKELDIESETCIFKKHIE